MMLMTDGMARAYSSNYVNRNLDYCVNNIVNIAKILILTV